MLQWSFVFTMAISWIFLADLARGQITLVSCDVLIAGASGSGVPAGVAAARLGRNVCVVEESKVIGGQFISVPELDENPPSPNVSMQYSDLYRELRQTLQDHAIFKYGLLPATSFATCSANQPSQSPFLDDIG